MPRAFVSYSWEGVEHENWVMDFATRLQSNGGVEVIFDRWHLQPGEDKQLFMERAVGSSDFVLTVCTEKYAERANKREGGVGYESMIITSEMAERIQTNKFIPVIRLGTFATSIPTYMKARLGIDLRGTPYREDQYETLLRTLHAEPLKPPPVGPKPNFNSRQGTSNPASPPSSGPAKNTAQSATQSNINISVPCTVRHGVGWFSDGSSPVPDKIEVNRDVLLLTAFVTLDAGFAYNTSKFTTGRLDCDASYFNYRFGGAITKLGNAKRPKGSQTNVDTAFTDSYLKDLIKQNLVDVTPNTKEKRYFVSAKGEMLRNSLRKSGIQSLDLPQSYY